MTLAARLEGGAVMGLTARITHARRGALSHAFRTRAEHVLLSPETCRPPRLMGHNGPGLIALRDTDHGGARGAGQGAPWAWARLAEAGIVRRPGQVLALLTQPRFLGFGFNPVSFWMLIDGDALLAVIAEVNNTFGQRHSYLLAAPDLAPITPQTPLRAGKVFHVSPFQDVAGDYRFAFDLRPDRVSIHIRHSHGAEGLEATLSGPFHALTPAAILAGALRRPGGALSVLVQIYWHALRLKLKGAAYRPLPAPPQEEISR